MKILLVDHTPIYRDILRQALAVYREFSLEFASTAAEARELASRHEFHFVAISRHLPDADGLEFVRELRRSGQFLVEPVVLLTSSVTYELAQEAEQAGATEIFRKQDIAELVSFLTRFLGVFTLLRGRVLYVEDTKDQRMVLDAQLRAWGMEVDSFAAAEDAWLAFTNKDYDLVICDIVLSGRMTGSRLVNRIRRQAGAKGDVLILAVTAFDSAARRIQLFHLGVDDYVSKPVVPVELHARIQGMLSRKLVADRNRALLDATSLAVLLTNDEGTIQSVNPEAENVFRYEAGEMVGMHITQLLPAEQTETGNFIERHAVSPDTRNLPWDLLAQRGNGEAFAVSCSVIETATMGVQRQFSVLIRDMSAERELERNLVAAKEAAESATRLKSEFLANMSHEIRTPMNGILGMTQLALDGRLGDEERSFVQKAHDSAMFLLGVLNDILDFSKIEAGKLTFEQAPFDLDEVLQRVGDMHMARAREKEIVLRLEKVGDVPNGLIGDSLRLTQILTNLVGNGIKFTERGSVVVRVSVAERDTVGKRVNLRFDIVDSGIGISEAQRNRLFQAFSQAEASTARVYGGSGLGLAICKSLVGMIGGSIGVDSVPGMGSTFYFDGWFGLSGAPKRQKEADAIADYAGLAGLNVLLAEDIHTNQLVACRFLEKVGISVTIANNGAEALEQLRAAPNHFAAILMDLQMPLMDGITATRAIRCNTSHDGLPIIAMTANAMSEDRQRCLDAGMQDYLAKPIDRQQLFSVLERWCGSPSGLVALSPALAETVAAPAPTNELDGYAQALARMAGKKDLYVEMWLDFMEGSQAMLSDLRMALTQNDHATAKRMAHSIKGLAATLGAGPLEREAASIEAALATEEVDTGTIRVAALEEHLAALQKIAPESLP